MDMLVDTCTGNTAEIPSKVESLGMANLLQSFFHPGRQNHDLCELFFIQTLELARVLVRYDHHVTTVVRIEVHDCVAVVGADEDEVFLVIFLLGYSAEKASGRLRPRERGNVFGSPRGKETSQMIDWLSGRPVDSLILPLLA